MNLEPYIYVYLIKNDILDYDTCFPRTVDGLEKAKKRVAKLEAMGAEAFYIVGVAPH